GGSPDPWLCVPTSRWVCPFGKESLAPSAPCAAAVPWPHRLAIESRAAGKSVCCVRLSIQTFFVLEPARPHRADQPDTPYSAQSRPAPRRDDARMRVCRMPTGDHRRREEGGTRPPRHGTGSYRDDRGRTSGRGGPADDSARIL